MLKYMDNQFLYEDKAVIKEVIRLENCLYSVVLGETIFYPKGGGQPNDLGSISRGDVVYNVIEVKFVGGEVHHIGTYRSGELKEGDEVEIKIDVARRELNSRIHTAGHLIDEAVLNLGYKDLIATKGYHYPDGPSVEYEGLLENTESFLKDVEVELNSLIVKGNKVRTFFAKKEELGGYCHSVPKDINEEKPIRVVVVYGDKGIPCGGTHVDDIRDVGVVVIRKVSCKKGIVKVSYSL